MKVVADAMVVIHLAKITVLEKSCDYFKHLVVPPGVYDEILAGKAKGYADARLVEELVVARKLVIGQITDHQLLRRGREFNIQRGELEALALYWQEGANYLATDDDSVRKKSVLLNVRLVGTPAILLRLYQEKVVGKEKFLQSLEELKKIGWFSRVVIDKISMEAA